MKTKWLWPLAICVIIFICSSKARLGFGTPVFPHYDKVVHYFVYGLLATSLYRIPYFFNNGYKGMLQVFIIVSLYGLSDEIHQAFVPNRSCDALDLMADMAGALTAIIAYRYFKYYQKLLEWKVVNMEA